MPAAKKKPVPVRDTDDPCFDFCVSREKRADQAPAQEPPKEPVRRKPTFEERKRTPLQEPLLAGPAKASGVEHVGERLKAAAHFLEEAIHAGGFDYMLVFPLPSVTTEAEEADFRKSHPRLTQGKDYASFLLDALVDPQAKEAASIACRDSLESLRTCAIELMISLLGTLGKERQCEIFQFTSIDSDELFVCVKVNEEIAENLANVGNYKLQLGGRFLEFLNVSITKDTESFVPAFMQYDAYMKEHNILRQFDVPDRPGEKTILRQVDKVRLIYDAITDYISISDLERLGLVKSVFPAHNMTERAPLLGSWATFRHTFKMNQPIDEVRDYFGEEIAFYFLFIQTVCKGLMYLAFLAIPCTLLMYVGHSSLGKVIFTFGNMIWFTVLLKSWRRLEAFYVNKWGMDGLDHGSIKDMLNPDFKGNLRPASYDENIYMMQADGEKQRRGYLMSVFTTIVYLMVVVAAASVNQMLAAWCDTHKYTTAFMLCSLGLTVQIKIFDFIWDMIGTWLTHQEQHVELNSWNQSKSLKTFFMKFITAFNVFYYIAFAQPTLDPVGCEAVGGCRGYLQQQLVVCFVTYIAFGIMDIGLPFATLKYRVYAEHKELSRKSFEEGVTTELPPLSSLEHQAKMLPYEGCDATDDYLQVMLPLSFVVLFGAVMPLCALLCFVSLATQLRADAWKLLNSYKRTYPSRASGIGIWDNILHVLSYLSVINNTALLLTQVDDFKAYLPLPADCSDLTAFFIMENVSIFLKVCYDFIVSDVTKETHRERDRQEVQCTRLTEAENEGLLGEVELKCSGDAAGTAFHKVEKLSPGHHLFTEAPPMAALW